MMRRILFVSILPVMLAVMMMFGYPGGTPVIEAAGTPGALVPMGDQLGDVGQYYSQISPNMKSRTYVYNTDSNSSHTATITIYSDTGATAATLSCTIAANRVLLLQMSDAITGTLSVSTGGISGCTSTTGLHGVYHMKIVESGGGAHLAVATNAWANDDKTVLGSYQAVADWAVSSTYYVPNVLVGRTTGWDTEIVVQNTSGTTNTVTFSWVKDGESTKYSNNSAALASNERRIFLASQLLYAGSGGTLTEKDGWAWMKVAGSGNMAVTSNVFKQGLTDGKHRAEYGSERMMSFEAPLAGTELFVPGFVVDGTASAFRVANASGSTANLTLRLYNSSGTLVDTYSPSLASERAGYYASNVFSNASNGTYTLRISSTQNVTAAAWHSSGGGHTGVTAQRVGDMGGTAMYLPYYWSDYYSWVDSFHSTKTSTGANSPTFNTYAQSSGSGFETWYWFDLYQYAYGLYDIHSNTNVDMYGKVTGSYPLGVGEFENYSTTNDHILSYNGIAKPANTWYVPFAPAPVVQFGWDTTEDANYPSVRFGWAGNPEDRSGTVPGWAKDLNWYDWGKNRARCEKYARYIPMDWGLGGGAGVTYNTEARLSAIKNAVPSACAGRPLLLANEPNYSAQANMTHVEIARQIRMYRAWPGDLHSQSYGHLDSIGVNRGYSVANGLTNPRYTDFEGLKTYWTSSSYLNWGSLPFDSLAVHFYIFKNAIPDGQPLQYPFPDQIREWRDEAVALGVPIQITEYGIMPVTDHAGPYQGLPNDPHPEYCPKSCIDARISRLNDGIISNLTLNGIKHYRQLMWYSFDNPDCPGNTCDTGDFDWRWPTAMELVSGIWQPTDPVGQTWVDDTKNR